VQIDYVLNGDTDRVHGMEPCVQTVSWAALLSIVLRAGPS
jgi:hypothetical protein